MTRADYWIVLNSRSNRTDRRYHTDRTCPRLQAAKKTRPATAHDLDVYELCQFCDETVDDVTPVGCGRSEAFTAAKDATVTGRGPEVRSDHD